ncbi:hypothetical protein NDU88_009402 [Pleurodeles waltl]|uniref:Uncharacterized protein n=1 Tax=Pleurodeles waltl TaxID=8319 RepID=A0AAV7QRF0_PLEWA|nr:hypothetical protein NDU88_009402 [Pleurodeles waltl]
MDDGCFGSEVEDGCFGSEVEVNTLRLDPETDVERCSVDAECTLVFFGAEREGWSSEYIFRSDHGQQAVVDPRPVLMTF